MNPYTRELTTEDIKYHLNPSEPILIGRERRRQKRKLERKLCKK